MRIEEADPGEVFSVRRDEEAARGVRAARVEVHSVPGGVTLRVEDDRAGFVVGDALARDSGRLSGMVERFRIAGGWLAIDSQPGGGTRIEGRVSYARTERAE